MTTHDSSLNQIKRNLWRFRRKRPFNWQNSMIIQMSIVEDTPEYKSALATLRQAQTVQSHSVVNAPYSGEAILVEQLQPEIFLPAGTAAFGLVSDTDVGLPRSRKKAN
jgi:hypothetical protein